MSRSREIRGAGVIVTAVLAGALAAGCGAPGVPRAGGGPAADGGVVTGEQADRIVRRVLEADAQLRSGAPGSETQITATYAGEGARAARGLALLIAKGSASKASPELGEVQVLANSQGSGYPRYLVGSSKPTADGLPWISLLVATNAQTPYRLTLTAQVLPGAKINAFPATADGSSVVTESDAYATQPVTLFTEYANGLTAKQDNPPYEPDVFADQVLSRARTTQESVAADADFTQSNQVDSDPFVALRQLNGDALVFGAIERTSDYAIKAGKQMPPTSIFSAFVPGRTALVQQARTTTAQFLVFSLPREGKAHLVAAAEVVVGASGY
ncbi:MAG: hypothetical protein ABI746_00705 [Dermatophilaceae bacterium]